ncbi:MAG TPA: glycosyltransferase family 4 protein [Bryobacteraceae bacterium]
MRVLYIHGTNMPPPTDRKRDPFFLLSEKLEGDILQPIWFTEPAGVDKELGSGSYPVYQSGKFRYHWFLSGLTGGLKKKLALIWFYISTGLRIHREQPIDCVVTYSHMATGLCGVILKLLTGARLIVEITTSPGLSYTAEVRKPGLRDRIKLLYSYFCLHVCLWSCDRAQLRAPGLLTPYRMLRKVPVSVMTGFVPVSVIPSHVDGEETSILLVGAPWYLKGADLLIDAFRRLSPDFPDVKLKLLGHFPSPEGDPLRALAAGSPQIEILKARPNPEVMEILSKASVFVLPSRCEGTPRVVIEAMASGIPAVGSDVGGIPYLIRDDQTGFVVPVGDVDALEERLRQLLSDAPLRARMGACGYETAHANFGEQAYVERFSRAVEDVVRGRSNGLTVVERT